MRALYLTRVERFRHILSRAPDGLTRQQAAARFGVSVSAVDRMLKLVPGIVPDRSDGQMRYRLERQEST